MQRPFRTVPSWARPFSKSITLDIRCSSGQRNSRRCPGQHPVTSRVTFDACEDCALLYTALVTILPGDWRLDAALGSCLLLGLRHGFDYDHLAAISDITAVQRNWKAGLRLGMTYALGRSE